jgi:excinuclease ABC subunit A
MKVTYKNRNVNDILKMTVDEAMKFFVDKRALLKKLSALRSVGLGYLRLGQSTASLSGGEAQRLKLASFLSETTKNDTGRLFLFDEPTTGLHHTDVAQLIKTFRNLIDRGNSVLVIEHNIQLIEAADHIIDLGPEGGDGGGELLAVGTPEELAANARSITGRYLARRPGLPSQLLNEEYLDTRAKRGDRQKFDAALAKVADIEPQKN